MIYFYLTQRSVIHKENVYELINNLCNKRLLVTFFEMRSCSTIASFIYTTTFDLDDRKTRKISYI